jgi:hypothetical protein
MSTSFFPLQSMPKCNAYVVLSVPKFAKWNGRTIVHHSSFLKTSGRSRFFVPSRLLKVVVCSVAGQHHFYAAPAPALSKNFDAAPAPVAPSSAPVAPDPAPTLLYTKATFLKRTKV